jgi:energy-coupling factor transport system ATP-binding protein
MSFIEARGVEFYYSPEEDKVIKGLDLKIEKGSYVAILGHNGCGKSTLAKLLCGIYEPTEGQILVDGMDTANEELSFDIRKKCGMVFQNPDNQLVASVVEEDVAFAPENLGYPREEIRKRVDEALSTVDMADYSKHATHKLSGGQKQRIAIAGVLAMSPECIVFDEATAMLDPTGRKEIVAAMKRLNKEIGITVVTITHYMNEAVEADRIVVMNEGEIIADGTPKEIFSRVEELKAVSLAVPQVTELLYQLEQDGFELPRGVLHAMDAADVLDAFIGGQK